MEHQSTPNGEHLLFATRKCSTILVDTFSQTREEIKNLFHAFAVLRLIINGEGTHIKILTHRQFWEDAASFRNVAYSRAHYLVGFHVGDIFIPKPDRTFFGMQEA